MTTSPAPALATDVAGAVLGRARDAKAVADGAMRDLYVAVADWADLHSTGAVTPDAWGPLGVLEESVADTLGGIDRFADLAGPGAPSVSEFAVVEIAAALGRTTDSGRALVGQVVEAKHRLPRTWARVVDGTVPTFRLRAITDTTRALSFEAAGFVDRMLAPVAHKVGLPTIERLAAEAVARFDPETVEADAADAADGLFFDIDLHGRRSIGEAGTVPVSGVLDRADAEDLDAAVSRLAEEQALLGSTGTLSQRRAAAVGELARRDMALDLSPGLDELDHQERDPLVEQGGAPATTGRRDHRSDPKPRQVVLHVHIFEAALSGTPLVDCETGGLGVHLARVERGRHTVLAEVVGDWCGVPGTQVVVRPVIDQRETITVDSYEIPDRLAAQVRSIRPTCVFPHCNRPAREGDADHVAEWPHGRTSTDNLAPLCRRHHRVKTHPARSGDPGRAERRWRYRLIRPGTWLWTSPHSLTYLVDPEGTIDLA